ncbi:MAG TPA: ABC transporter ATP-binding protein [Devosiaceae bacterium]|nr:ABC transporter ATP-binding protein [Devosiaceae bacterium]
MSFLDISGISKQFGAVTALDGVDLTAERGSRTAIVGPSGSGKTTLLRIIAGFEVPDAGRVLLDGEMLADGPRSLPTHQRGIGVVAQDGALFPHLSVADNIGFGLPRGFPGRDSHILAMLEMVELERSMLGRRPDELSGGQQQRVALARAMATRPKLMLLDEPFSALDTGLRASMRKAVSELLQAAGITTILITHDQAEALSFADQVAVMRAGSLPQVGTPRDIYFHPRDRMIAEFMGDCLILEAEMEEGRARCGLGHLEIDNGRAQGTVQIMLRPEQILLVPMEGRSAPPPNAVRAARVLEIDFAGRTSTVRVEVRQGDVASALLLRGVGSRGLEPGAEVGISIVGPAHLLAR